MQKLLLVGAVVALAATVAVLVWARRASPPADVGPVDGRLRPCPESPNCVSSQAARAEQRVEPFSVPPGEEPRAFLERVVALVESRGDATVAQRSAPGESPAWAHAVFVTRLVGFRDDLELLLDEPGGVVHVRSASRLGHSDLGANRKRVEALRAALAAGTGAR